MNVEQKRIEKVVGVTFDNRQELLEKMYADVAGLPAEGTPATIKGELVLEPDNTYDKNAIAVVVGGEKVGYLSKQFAFWFAGRSLQFAPDRVMVVIKPWTDEDGTVAYSATVEFYTVPKSRVYEKK